MTLGLGGSRLIYPSQELFRPYLGPISSVVDFDVRLIQGWGAQTTGGEGKPEVHVTNLNDSGAGSLRTALLTSGGAFIVFDVEGTINQTGANFRMVRSNITVAGETAPGAGITIENGGFVVRSNNIIVRHIRGRSGSNFFNIRPWNNCNNVLIHNCSATNYTDDTVSLWWNATGGGGHPDMYNITLQNNLFAENPSRNVLTGGVTDLSEGIRFDLKCYKISIHHSYWPNNGHRCPLIKSQRCEVINNVVWNWTGSRIGGTGNQSESDWINNHWIPGADSGTTRALIFEWLDSGGDDLGLSSVYLKGNILEETHDKAESDPLADNWGYLETNEPLASPPDQGNPVHTDNQRTSPLSQPPIPVIIQPATLANSLNIAENSGAFPHDAVDLALIQEMRDLV